jgi:hypothetical protein
MSYFHTALTLSRWAVVAMGLPPLALILICAAASLVASLRKAIPRFEKRYHWYAFAHVLFFPAIIAVGTLRLLFLATSLPRWFTGSRVPLS